MRLGLKRKNGWTGTWTPQGDLVKIEVNKYSKVYSATWVRTKPKGQEAEDIPTQWQAKHFLITITGNHVTIARKDPDKVGKYDGGAECTYEDTIEGNRVENGTGGCGVWKATIKCN